MEKVIVLSRCSTIYQDVSQQTEAILKQVYQDGYTDQQIIIIENNESGSKLSFEEREGLNTLYKYIEEDNSIKRVYCFEISRIGRKPEIVFKVRDFLVEHNINLICIKPFFKMLNDDGSISEASSFMFGIFTVMAESETRTRVERIKRGKAKSLSIKKYRGGWLAFGYTLDKDNYIVEKEEEASIVRDIFSMYIQNLSIGSIGKELTEQGRINYDRELMAKSFICKVLANKDYYDNKRYPPIISEEVFNKAQEIKANRLIKSKTNTKHIYYCRSIIFDYESKLTMKGEAGNECYRQKEHHKQISINLVDSIIWTITKIHKATETKNSRGSKLKKIIEDISILENKIEVCNKKIIEFTKQIDKVEERLIYGRLSEEAAETIEK